MRSLACRLAAVVLARYRGSAARGVAPRGTRGRSSRFQATARAHTHPQDLPADFRAEVQRSASGGDVSWRLLRGACRALRESGSEVAGARPNISCAVAR